jgi:hypothetical protein
MIRSSMNTDSPHYSSFLTAGKGVANQIRRCDGCLTEHKGESITASSVWLRVVKVGTSFSTFYKEEFSSQWEPYGKSLSIPKINSNGYYLGVAASAHNNNDPSHMVTLQVSNVDLFRACTSKSTTPHQCDQATNCELGALTGTCYNTGTVRTRKVKIQLPGTQYLHLAEVEVFDEYGKNVALNRPALMSSVYDTYYFPYPGDGVDGVIADSMFHTDIEQKPWWEVDLGEDLAEVLRVVVYNRNHDCDKSCQARADGALIQLIDDQGNVFDSRDLGEAKNSKVIPFTPISIGTYQTRKVKIQLTTTNSLQLTEVQVFDEAGVNRALNRPATMSCTYVDDNGPYHSNPGDALDGITTGENMFHTCDQFGAWWEVDLGAALVNVKKVVIYNRQDCPACFGRLSNAKVLLIDNSGVVFNSKNLGNMEGVGLLNLDILPSKKSIVPPKEYEPVSLTRTSTFPITRLLFRAQHCFCVLHPTRLDTLSSLEMDGAGILSSECMTI